MVIIEFGQTSVLLNTKHFDNFKDMCFKTRKLGLEICLKSTQKDIYEIYPQSESSRKYKTLF